jgi:hypothetical protein
MATRRNNNASTARRTGFDRRLAARLGLDVRECATLARLTSPQAIQAYLYRVPCNHEQGGETVLSVREVLRRRRAHCIEGAFLAACALWLHGDPPLVVHLDCDISDYPHVIAVFKRGRYWGAISKTNGASLRFRDPVYRSLRELALSYFHEYNNRRGERTLRSFTRAIDLSRVDPTLWVTQRTACWAVHDQLAAAPHRLLLAKDQGEQLSRLDPFERRAGKFEQYPAPRVRRRRKKS